ncbi:hypothetical protein KAR91_39690 [Candidatus Pacearchaeota archaeon]|nr:hypothetical protein [Candidatus Pacearchaeota archaeon]
MDIKNQTADLIKKNYKLPEEVTMAMFDDGLLTEHQCKKVLIRDEFVNSSTRLGNMELKESIAEEFCVSLSTVEKYLRGH